MNTKLKLIIVWQILIILFAISVLCVQIHNDEMFHNRQLYPDRESWEKSGFIEILWYPEYYQEFKDAEEIIISIYIIAVLPITIAGCIGLLLRKNWGRISTIISMIMTILFFTFSLASVSLLQLSEITHNIFVDVVVSLFICQAFIVFSILSLLYIRKPRLKNYYKG
jgi:hypothetical protein